MTNQTCWSHLANYRNSMLDDWLKRIKEVLKITLETISVSLVVVNRYDTCNDEEVLDQGTSLIKSKWINLGCLRIMAEFATIDTISENQIFTTIII